jgi:hypothetical protein
MEAFIDGCLIEIAQFPRYGDGDMFTIKDYFYYNSNILSYSVRETVIPVSNILNKSELPSEDVIRDLINNKEPVMRRLIDLDNQLEQWVFVPTEEK